MPCLSNKIAVAATLSGMALSAGAMVAGTPTVAISAAGLAALLVSFVGCVGAAVALSDCLERAGQPDEAAKLRRAVEEMKRESEMLKQVQH